MAGAAVNSNTSRSLQRSDTAESSANGAANGAAGDAYNYSSVYGVLPAARDILVPRCCMPGLAVKQVRSVFVMRNCLALWLQLCLIHVHALPGC
jgi:hypothetical protein